MIWIAFICILIAGLGNPVQTALNSKLRMASGSPFMACYISFIVGLVALMLLTLFENGSLMADPETLISLPWWIWLGGVMGIIGVIGNILIFPKLGSTQTVLMPMIGQIGMSMLIDSFGWFSGNAIPLAKGRIAGLIVIIVGMVFFSLAKRNNDKGKRSGIIWPLCGILCGMTFAIQPAINGQLAQAIDAPVMASFYSFTVSTIILTAMLLVIPSERRLLSSAFKLRSPWWMYIGGLIGAYYVTAFSKFTPVLGVGAASLTGIIGMMTMGIIIDANGMLGAQKQRINIKQYISLAFILAGAVLINL